MTPGARRKGPAAFERRRDRTGIASAGAAIVRAALLVWFAVAAGGCGGGGGPDAESEAALAIALPDLSAADLFVRDQVRAQHASLMGIVQTPTANAARRAGAYGDMGKLLMAAALHDAAEPHLRRAQTLAPDDARWPYYLGHLYRTTGALEDSVAAFKEVLRLRPDDALTLLWLGEVHLLLGRPEEAEPLFRTQLAMQPDSVVAHVGIGRAALAANDYARAVRFLEEGLRLSGQTAVGVHYPLALAYRGLGRLDRAEAHMGQRADVAILAEDPLMEELDTLIESPRAYERRGNRALSRRDWVTAAEHFRRGLVLEPADPTLRHRLGTVRFQMGDPGGAFAEFERILETAPDFALAHFSLGVLLEGAGRRPAAIERFEAAVRHEPAYVEARLALAGLLRREGRFEEALTQYERVMAEAAAGDPRIEEAPFGHAVTLVRLGRHADARDRFGEGMAAYPDQPFLRPRAGASPQRRNRSGGQGRHPRARSHGGAPGGRSHPRSGPVHGHDARRDGALHRGGGLAAGRHRPGRARRALGPRARHAGETDALRARLAVAQRRSRRVRSVSRTVGRRDSLGAARRKPCRRR